MINDINREEIEVKQNQFINQQQQFRDKQVQSKEFQINSFQQRQKYEQFFHGINLDDKNQENLIATLDKHGEIQYNTANLEKGFQASIFFTTYNYQVIHFEVKIGAFTLPIVILNVQGESMNHDLQNIQSTFATIISANTAEKRYKIKCFAEKNNFSRTLAIAMKQYAFLKIASVFGIGPQIDKLFGFDIIIYENCIQFSMEQCYHFQKIKENQINQLKKKLRILHQLHLVHLDIKPANIMISPFSKKPIFIDFGFSQFVQANYYQKTQINFKGSLLYCSPEMRQCYNQSPAMVNLYYNDVHCFQKSIEQIQVNYKNKQQMRPFKENLLDQSFESQLNNQIYKGTQYKHIENYTKMKIKYRIYSLQSISEDGYQICLTKNCYQFLNFIKLMPYSRFLEQQVHLPLQQKMQKQKKEIQIYLNCQHKKQNFLMAESFASSQQISKLPSAYQIPNKFGKRVDWFDIGQYLNFENFDNIIYLNLMNKENKNLVLISSLAQKIPTNIYFVYLSNFLDLRSAFSNFKQKTKAAANMMSRYKLQNGKQQSQLISIHVCTEYIMKYCLKNYENSFQQIIPILVHNLIILQMNTMKQIISIFQQIASLSLQPINHAKMLFRCILGCDWISFRSISKYKWTKIEFNIFTLIVNKLLNLYQVSPKQNQLIFILRQLLIADKNMQTPLYKLRSQIITKILKQIIKKSFCFWDRRFLIQITIFYYTIQLNHTDYNPIENLKIIQRINYAQKSLTNSFSKFQYYNFRIAKSLLSTNNVQFLYNKFYSCLQLSSLIHQYQLFYRYKYIEYSVNGNIVRYYKDIFQYMHLYQFVSNKQMVIALDQTIQSLKMSDITGSGLDKLQILTFLTEKLSIKSIMSIEFPENNYFSKIIHFYEIFAHLVRIYYQLNKQDFNAITDIKLIANKLQQYWKDIICKSCKQNSLKFLVLTQGFILEYQDRQLAYTRYLEIFYQLKSKNLVDSSKNLFLFKILRIGTLQPVLDAKYQILKWFYSEISNQNQYFVLINNKESKYIFEVVWEYLIIKRKDLNQFWKMNQHLILFLDDFPQKQFVSNYLKYTDKFMSKCSQQSQKIVQFLKDISVVKYLGQRKMEYTILLLSVCLNYQRCYDKDTLKIVKTICKFLQSVTISARSLILAKLYYYLLCKIPNQLKEKQVQLKGIFFQTNKFVQYEKKRLIRITKYRFKFFLKYCVCSYSLKQFQRYLKVSRHKREFRNRNIWQTLQGKIKQYYKNVRSR